MPDQVKPDQKIRLLPELWKRIDEQAKKEGFKSRANFIEVLIKRGFEHPLTLYHNNTVPQLIEKAKDEVGKTKIGNLVFDTNLLNKGK